MTHRPCQLLGQQEVSIIGYLCMAAYKKFDCVLWLCLTGVPRLFCHDMDEELPSGAFVSSFATGNEAEVRRRLYACQTGERYY